MTNNRISFTAEQRTLIGKKVSTLRKSGIIPANISGDIQDPVAISIPVNAFEKLLAQAGETGLIYLNVNGIDHPVLVDEVQRHGISDVPTHVVFKQVNLKEKIEADVTVELVGENTISNAVVVLVHDSVTVEALPADLPDRFEINVEELVEIGQQITFSQLKYDKNKVTLKIEDDQMDEPVVILQEHVEQVEEEVAEEPTETKIIGEEEKAAEAAAAAEEAK